MSRCWGQCPRNVGYKMNATKSKVIATVLILSIGVLLPFAFYTTDEDSASYAPGIAIDFDEMDVDWVHMDLHQFGSGWRALENACWIRSYSLTLDPEGNIDEINGVASGPERSWGYWGVPAGTTVWERIGSNSDPKDYVVTAWAYRAQGETPTVAVDALGQCIYGHSKANSIVSLSASATEILGSLEAIPSVVGVDEYSDYPQSVMEGRMEGSISVVGDYKGPSFELILSCKPDLVIGDDSNGSQADVCRKLISNGTNTILLYKGENLDTILRNIYIVGVVSGRAETAETVLTDISMAIETLLDIIGTSPHSTYEGALVTLTPDKSPYASGTNTYISDMLYEVGGFNVMDDMEGWNRITSEMIANANPSKIIIIISVYDGKTYDYDDVLASMEPEWKSTDAFKKGEIYIVQDGAANILQRCSPRVAQLMEILSLILQPDAFGSHIPKVIGDDYQNSLVYTKDLGYDL